MNNRKSSLICSDPLYSEHGTFKVLTEMRSGAFAQKNMAAHYIRLEPTYVRNVNDKQHKRDISRTWREICYRSPCGRHVVVMRLCQISWVKTHKSSDKRIQVQNHANPCELASVMLAVSNRHFYCSRKKPGNKGKRARERKRLWCSV